MESTLIFDNKLQPPYSLRSAHQELFVPPLPVRRTIDGRLIAPQTIKKYQTKISCEDQNAITMFHLENGEIGGQIKDQTISHTNRQIIDIGCMVRIWHSVSDLQINLERRPVEGSVIGINRQQEVVPLASEQRFAVDDNIVCVGFRPWLRCMIIDFSVKKCEWDLKTEWSMHAVEI